MSPLTNADVASELALSNILNVKPSTTGEPCIRLDVRSDLVEARAMYARLGYLEVPRLNDHPYVEHWFEKHL